MIKKAIFAIIFLLILFSGKSYAVEAQCPGGLFYVPGGLIVFCDDFTDSTVHTSTFYDGNHWNVDAYCCYDNDAGTANAVGSHTGGVTRDPIISPGYYDPGKCKLPADCRGNGTTFTGNQGYASPNAWFSGYYWECCGNHYGDRRLPGNYTELRFRWYVYLNNAWPIGNCGQSQPDLVDPTYPVDGNCGSKMFMLANAAKNQSMGYMMLYSSNSGCGDGKSKIDMYGDAPETGGLGESRCQNQGNDLTLQGNQWYLYEWHVKLNTGSNNDGISEFWIDPVTPGVQFHGPQTLRERHTNIRFTGANGITSTTWGFIGISPNSNYGYCHPGQYSNGGANGAPKCPVYNGIIKNTQPDAYYKISNIVVSTSPTIMIGPVNTGALPLLSAPTGVVATP